MKMILVIASLMLLAVHSVHGQCTEVPNCSTCEDRGPECISCPDGKVMSSDKQSCLDCPTNCAKCEREGDTDDLVCLKCSSGYLKEGECTACELANCVTCTVEGEQEVCTLCNNAGYSLSGGECTGCATGKYLDGTSCKSCPSNAISCTTGPTVTACKNEGVSYVKATDGASCKPCDGCVKCALDDTDAKCTECKDNQYLTEDGECAFCTNDAAGTKCKTCEDEGKCTECNTGYYVADDECSACPANCDECSNDETEGLICATCSTKYGLNEEIICQKCPSNCDVCNTAGVCTDCATGYGVDADGECEKCVDNCAACADSSGTVQCSACSSGYVRYTKNSKKLCIACDDDSTGIAGCDTCTVADDTAAVTCDDDGCKTGYAQYTDSDSVKQCVKCDDATNGIANCGDTCTAADTTAAVTCADDGCKTGYAQYTDSDSVKQCVKCDDATTGVAGCLTCTAADTTAAVTCSDSGCQLGYAQYTDGDSAKQCSKCDNTANGIANCGTCTAADTAGAITCSNDGCQEGYVQYTDDDSVKQCTTCSVTGCADDQCEIQSGKAFCTECKAGYRKAYSGGDATGKCTACNDNCAVCDTETSDNSQTCTTCDTFFVAGTDPCEACPENCQTCSDANTCTDCKTGYGKDSSGACVECIADCDECDADADGKQICTACNAKYYKDDDDCVSCTSNCLECSYDAGIMGCGKCADGYVLNGGECDKCPSNCQECSSATKCKTGKCNNGYAVEANECQACATLTGIANCALCTEKPDANSSAPCLACNTGFTLKDNLQSGDDAECVSTTGLTCQGGMIADRAFQCDEGKCTAETSQTSDNLCGRQCHVCGDYDNNEFIAAEECKTDNSSGVVTLCPSGFCAMKSRTVDGGKVVAGGCLPVKDTCTAPDEVECSSINEGEEKLTQCTKCCDENLCLQSDLTTGLEESNLAPANSANLLVLVSCSIGALTLLLSRA